MLLRYLLDSLEYLAQTDTRNQQVRSYVHHQCARVPTHTHKGNEITVILSGGFSDELGLYHAGDFIARDGQHKHSPTALQNDDCICLTILDAPIKFTGWQRIFNPFMAWCQV